MKKSEAIDQLATALSKAQGMFTAAERDYTAKVETRKGGSYSFNYADLAAYLDVCRGPLSENGLAIVQEPVADGQKAKVTTLLMHSSGQWIEFDPLELCVAFKEPGEIPTPQEMGSLITYARRYSQSAGLNMASEQDDDGNQASGNRAETGKREPNPACPNCGKSDSVIVGKPEYGGGFVCYARKGGCGEKWQKPSEADAKAKAEADKIAEQHGMTTADRLPAKLVTFDAALSKVPTASDLAAIAKGADWLEKEIIAKRFTANEGETFAEALAERAIELCAEPADFDEADKIIRGMASRMRIHDARATELRVKLADAKETKCGAAA